MALLITPGEPHGHRPRPRTIVVGLCMLGLAAACGLAVREQMLGLGFDHQLHYEEEGLDCSDCHMTVEDEDQPGMPELRMCQLCHDDDSEAEKPEEQRIAQLFDGHTFRATGVSRLPDEVIFSHLSHVEAVEECSTCHVGIEQNHHPANLEPIGMADCMDCHESYGAPNECATCHSEIGLDWAPPSHDLDWTKHHGAASRGSQELLVNRCDMCHERSSCDECHQREAPDTHNNFWRLRGHAIAGSLARTDCTTCHQPDFCDRCHRETEPLSHRGMWGGVRNDHCVGCHFPLRGEGCITCHKTTPSHQTATPLPPDHSPQRDCRICHGVDAPMPHADGGALCIICHR